MREAIRNGLKTMLFFLLREAVTELSAHADNVSVVWPYLRKGSPT